MSEAAKDAGAATKEYEYFDTPEGQDVHKKLWVVLKPTTLSALALATSDVMLYSRPKGYLATLGRYAYITLPIVGMSTAFVLTTNSLCNIRKEDDKINWIAGGIAAGGVFGAWRRSSVAGWSMAGILAILGLGKKYTVQNGYVIFPTNFKQAHGGLRAVRHDWTLTKDVSAGPGWTTGKN